MNKDYCIISISDSRKNNIFNIMSIMGEPHDVKFFDISNGEDVEGFKDKYKSFHLNEYLSNRKYNTNPARTDGEIGCWMSHFNAWNYILENNLDGMFIVEDDCFLTKSKYDVVIDEITNNNYDIFTAGQWAEMYYLTASTARFLVDEAFEEGFKKMPVDEFIFDSVREFGLHGLIGANIVSQTDQMYGSQISAKIRASNVI